MSKRIHICLVGGEDAHKRIDLSKKLLHDNFKVTILGTKDYNYPEDINFIKYSLKRSLNVVSDIKTVFEYRKIVRENDFDLIQTFDTKPAFLVPLSLFGKKVIIVRTITGLGKVFINQNLKSLPGRFLYVLLHFIVRNKVQHTTFQNIEDRDIFLKNRLITASNHSMIYGSGIPLGDIKDIAPRNGKVFTVICVSRLIYEKGIVNYLEAAKICSEMGYKIRFMLVGPLEEDTTRLNEKILDQYSAYVEWLGERKDITDLLKKSHVFALPTFYREGFARVLLEASAVGLPLVTTDVPGVRDIARHMKEALIVPIQDSQALANAIIRLFKDKVLCNTLSKNALSNVELYSLSVISKNYINLYRNLI
ncbi:glycosyltransferase [Muricauda sp. SCSIO 64092]|uniref:glycosyltransferase n=1 Tax=Allomuricauda sp. SCSIO 64092 TaxID=2908842 RepID=UPI001FF61465|nr:glycosyltransferase [Muricauda sp. SCSIO 64092]UOY06103.1 glycosyltransferase [Muricauda sp. SCSIO 64092]